MRRRRHQNFGCYGIICLDYASQNVDDDCCLAGACETLFIFVHSKQERETHTGRSPDQR